MPGKRTNHCTTQHVALDTIGWYYIPTITTEDFITGKLVPDPRKLSFLILTLHFVLYNIVQIRIHCSYQKIQVFYLIPNLSLQLYSFYGCIAHFVSDLVLNPEYRFSQAVAHIKPYCKSIKNTCTLIHNPRLFILCKVFAPKHVHKLTLYDCRTCIWYMPEWLCSFQQFVFVCDNFAIWGKLKSKL